MSRARRWSARRRFATALEWTSLSRLVAACVLVVLSFLCHDAAAEEHGRVIVRVSDTGLGALVERIRGQVSDLPIDIGAVTLPGLEPSDEERRRAALQLGRDHGAIAVVWFEPQSDGAIFVCVAASASGDVLVRRLDALPRRDDAATSERLETAAVVVRATLEALLETGKLQALSTKRTGEAVPEATQPRDEPAPTPPQPAPPQRIMPVADTSPKKRPSKVAARVALGWLAVADGQTQSGIHGAMVRVDVLKENLGIGLSGAMSLPGTIDDDVLHLRLVRRGVTADAFFVWPIAGAFAIEGHAGAGLVQFGRSTIGRPSAGAFATPSRTFLSPEFTGDVVLSVTPASVAPGVRLFASGGAGFVPSPPRFDAMTSSGVVRGPALSALQLRFAAGLGWNF